MTLPHATVRTMNQNLWWAVGINEIAFLLASGVWYPLGLSPEVVALSMSGGSAVVAISALMLKRTRLAGIKTRDHAMRRQPTRPFRREYRHERSDAHCGRNVVHAPTFDPNRGA